MKTVTINYYLVNGMTGRKVFGRNKKTIRAEFPDLKNEKLMKVGSEKWQLGDDEKLVIDSKGILRTTDINDERYRDEEV